jgi:hypothetical protein
LLVDDAAGSNLSSRPALQRRSKFWWSFEPVKFLKWVESVDHFAVPIAVDIGLAVFAAGLATAILRYILEAAA